MDRTEQPKEPRCPVCNVTGSYPGQLEKHMEFRKHYVSPHDEQWASKLIPDVKLTGATPADRTEQKLEISIEEVYAAENGRRWVNSHHVDEVTWTYKGKPVEIPQEQLRRFMLSGLSTTDLITSDFLGELAVWQNDEINGKQSIQALINSEVQAGQLEFAQELASSNNWRVTLENKLAELQRHKVRGNNGN